jgi:hypothetical protein
LVAAGHAAPKVCVLGAGYAVKVVTWNGATFKVKFSGAKLDKTLLVPM